MIDISKLPSKSGYMWVEKSACHVNLMRGTKKVGALWIKGNETFFQRTGGCRYSINWVDPYVVAPDLIRNVEARA